MQRLSDAIVHSSRWLRECALPLWASSGFDERRDAFEEQLEFSGAPVAGVARRLMVQARQVSVFAAAALSGVFSDGAKVSLRAARSMIDTYFESDGAPGWAFSADQLGRLVDAKRDLYAHAFAIFAIAWAMRLERDRRFENVLARTLGFLDDSFADRASSGYWDCLPRPDSLRRQNPHMHLFEAFLSLYETTRRDDVLERCRKLHQLALSRFFNPSSGMIREHFNDRWIVHPSPGAGRVEPGHLFEWAWLLRRFEAATGMKQDDPVSRLIGAALRIGFNGVCGRMVDEIDERGRLRIVSSRCWPHAEALRALAGESSRTGCEYFDVISALLERLYTVYCVNQLNGGWIDHVDAVERSLNKTMPASTLYHLYFGLHSIEAISIPSRVRPERDCDRTCGQSAICTPPSPRGPST
jgi:mannose/cellobiose epimerase-like protein (N-acyl-D-glucosamine 2-epimerase family)